MYFWIIFISTQILNKTLIIMNKNNLKNMLQGIGSLSLIVVCFVLVSSCDRDISQTVSTKENLIWSDEFEGESLDTAYWSY